MSDDITVGRITFGPHAPVIAYVPATTLDKVHTELAAERARTERADEALTQTIEQRDALEERIEAIYRALGGEGEWCAKLPPEDPPNSGDLGADALALAEAASRVIAQRACGDLAMQTALAHARAAVTACRADRDRLKAAESKDSLKTREINILTVENRALLADRDRLRDLVLMMQERAKEGFRAWDNDEDARAGKCLKALAGLSPGYWPEMDALTEGQAK